jgi:hypothetical protein
LFLVVDAEQVGECDALKFGTGCRLRWRDPSRLRRLASPALAAAPAGCFPGGEQAFSAIRKRLVCP